MSKTEKLRSEHAGDMGVSDRGADPPQAIADGACLTEIAQASELTLLSLKESKGQKNKDQNNKDQKNEDQSVMLDPTRYGDWEKNGRCIDF